MNALYTYGYEAVGAYSTPINDTEKRECYKPPIFSDCHLMLPRYRFKLLHFGSIAPMASKPDSITNGWSRANSWRSPLRRIFPIATNTCQKYAHANINPVRCSLHVVADVNENPNEAFARAPKKDVANLAAVGDR